MFTGRSLLGKQEQKIVVQGAVGTPLRCYHMTSKDIKNDLAK